MQLRYFIILCGLVIAVAAVVPYSTPPPPTPSPPKFDFAISVSPSELEVLDRDICSVMVTVSAQSINQSTQPVSLTISGLPRTAGHWFEPETGVPPFTSKLIIDLYDVAPIKYIIIITGSGGERTHSTTLNLIVKSGSIYRGGV